MKSEKLLEAMNDLPEELIAEANVRRRHPLVRIAAVAACFVVLLAGMYPFLRAMTQHGGSDEDCYVSDIEVIYRQGAIYEVVGTNYASALERLHLPDAITDESQLAASIEQQAGDLYWQDFTEGAVFNELELLDGYDYYVLCLAYDNWGTPCSVSKAKFNVPKIPLQGDPQVEVTFSDITDRSFNATLTPNADVSSFSFLYAWKGQIELQSAMMGGVEGYLNSFFAASSETEYTIEADCNYYEPGNEWEIAILPKDADGRYDKAVFHYTQTAFHGDGTTTPDVDVNTGDYYMSQWNDDMGQPVQLPTLRVNFTPNAGANCYRYSVWTKDVYDQAPEECIASVATDMDPNSWATSYYYNIDPISDEFQVDPNTTIVIVAVPKANDGTWGEPVVVEYTTPAEAAPAEEAPAATAAKGLAMPAAKSVKAASTVNFQRQFQNGGRMQTLPFMMQPVKKAVSTGKTIKVVDLSK